MFRPWIQPVLVVHDLMAAMPMLSDPMKEQRHTGNHTRIHAKHTHIYLYMQYIIISFFKYLIFIYSLICLFQYVFIYFLHYHNYHLYCLLLNASKLCTLFTSNKWSTLKWLIASSSTKSSRKIYRIVMGMIRRLFSTISHCHCEILTLLQNTS